MTVCLTVFMIMQHAIRELIHINDKFKHKIFVLNFKIKNITGHFKILMILSIHCLKCPLNDIKINNF